MSELWFAVDHLDVERLLADWRWLVPTRMTLLARNAFGNLFLRDGSGAVIRLDVAIGKVTTVADSEAQFRELLLSGDKREDWFAQSDQEAFASRGLKPDTTQCIAFSVPLVFAESGSPVTPYVADLYDQVSFLGDLNRQIADLPEGAKVKLVIGRDKEGYRGMAQELTSGAEAPLVSRAVYRRPEGLLHPTIAVSIRAMQALRSR